MYRSDFYLWLLVAVEYFHSVRCFFLPNWMIWILPLPPICTSKQNSTLLQTAHASHVILHEDVSRCQSVAATVILCLRLALGFFSSFFFSPVVDRTVLFPQKSEVPDWDNRSRCGEEEEDLMGERRGKQSLMLLFLFMNHHAFKQQTVSCKWWKIIQADFFLRSVFLQHSDPQSPHSANQYLCREKWEVGHKIYSPVQKKTPFSQSSYESCSSLRVRN